MKRNVMRIMSLAFAGIMAAGALTACGGNNTAATTAAPAEQTSAAGESAAEEATAASGEKKVLKVAMECAYAPYNSQMIPTALYQLMTATNMLMDTML